VLQHGSQYRWPAMLRAVLKARNQNQAGICNLNSGFKWQCGPAGALVNVMTQHHRDPQTFWGPPTPITSRGPIDSVKHSLPSKKPIVLKCVCAGFKVPFYCPVHARVENPNWPLLKPVTSQQ
jgi:hypothetical protein